MPIKYIGRKTDFKGKTLWEILANLKNFGVGRLVIRQRLQRYPEPCYMKILKVGALPEPGESDKDTRKVMALVERTFRGKTESVSQIDSSTYKPDFQLVPKDQEHLYTKSAHKTHTGNILPSTMDFPPLLREIIYNNSKQTKDAVVEEPRLKVCYNTTSTNNHRIAHEGETPTITLQMGLGTPASPSLYANIKKEQSDSTK